MNLSAAYLALLAFSLAPQPVQALDWGMTLLDEFPSFFFEPSDTSLSSMILRHQQAMEHAFFRGALQPSAPSQLTSDSDRFQVTLNLPSEFSPEDLNVDFDERNRVLTLSGQYETTNRDTGYRSVNKFSRSFTVDPFVESDSLTATMDGGVLTVAAPRDVAKVEHVVRSIPVRSKASEIPALPIPDKAPEVPALPIPASVKNAPQPPGREETRSEDEVDEFDPFHVKERVGKLFQKREEPQAAVPQNPNKRLGDAIQVGGFNTSELRRRR